MPNKKVPSKSKKDPVPTKRRIKQPVYKSFRISKRIKQPKPPIKSALYLFITSVRFLMPRWRLFGGIILVYIILTIILVKGFAISEWGLLSNPSISGNDASGAYQSLLAIIISLSLIWALRNGTSAKKVKITVKDTFYKGLYPFVPFILVLIIIGLQLVPLLIANYLYGGIFGGGLAVTALEKGLWLIFFFLLALLSLYMLSSSLFALYIVTLPDVAPVQALRSAKDLVRHRRMAVMRKVLFLPVALLLIAALIIVPAIAVSPVVAEQLFFLMSMVAPAIGHSYFYHLYRDLL